MIQNYHQGMYIIFVKKNEIISNSKYCRCFEVSAEKFYLVFEDLTVSKFKNADRQKGLDKTHFEILLTKLAKWHAGTAVLLTMVNSYIINKSHIISF